MARVRALVRRRFGDGTTVIEIGELSIDTAARLVLHRISQLSSRPGNMDYLNSWLDVAGRLSHARKFGKASMILKPNRPVM